MNIRSRRRKKITPHHLVVTLGVVVTAVTVVLYPDQSGAAATLSVLTNLLWLWGDA